MWEQAISTKPQQTRKLKANCCEAQAEGPVTIPESWSLSDAQRNFIESMIETKSK